MLAGALVVAAVVAEVVPFFSHADAGTDGCSPISWPAPRCSPRPPSRCPARAGASPPPSPRAIGVVAVAVATIVLVPSPRIDVWVTLQQASDGLAHGQNMYAMTWQNSPGIQDAFTYLPWTAVLLAPGRWLAGDVRWALLVALLVGLACTALLAPRRDADGDSDSRLRSTPRWSALSLGAATLLALAPGAVTQAEQAWTEPLLFACLAGWALLVQRRRAWWAVLPLALGCASKQHLAVLLPVLACWPAFGWRRALTAGGLAGLLVLPWFVASPADFWHDTVSLLVSFHPIRFANTWFIAARTELGWTPPFWLTGLVVLGVLVGACVAVWRRRPELPELLGWLALVLLTANLVNKQAFYNQYWLVGALVALAVAASPVGQPVAAEPSAQLARDRLTGQQRLQPHRQVVPAPLRGDPLAAASPEALGQRRGPRARWPPGRPRPRPSDRAPRSRSRRRARRPERRRSRPPRPAAGWRPPPGSRCPAPRAPGRAAACASAWRRRRPRRSRRACAATAPGR